MERTRATTSLFHLPQLHHNAAPQVRLHERLLEGWPVWYVPTPNVVTPLADPILANKVVFCTGGAGTICSAQVRALVHLGANACIIGRNVEKTERVAQDIATARQGAKVIGIGAVDVRKFESLKAAVDRCVEEFGGIDFVM